MQVEDIEKIGCTCKKQLVVYSQNKWYVCLVDKTFKEYDEQDECTSLSEFVVNRKGTGKFKTLNGTVEKQLDAVVIQNAKMSSANGTYNRMLGGYKHEKGFWFIKNNCGQEMIVFPTKTCNKIIAIKNSHAIMEIDLSVTSDEIRDLVNEHMWKRCKEIVDALRQTPQTANNYLNVTVHTIESKNRGRKGRSWLK